MSSNANSRICLGCNNINSLSADYCTFCGDPTQRLYEPEKLQKANGANRPALIGILMTIPVLLLGPTILGLVALVFGISASGVGLNRSNKLKEFAYKKTGRALSVVGLVFHSLYLALVIFVVLVGAYYGVLQLPLSSWLE